MLKITSLILFLSLSLALSGCSVLMFSETTANESLLVDGYASAKANEEDQDRGNKQNNKASEDINTQNTLNLWVWIAPEYRDSQANMHSDYLILPVK